MDSEALAALAALAPAGALAREVAVLFSSQEPRRTREGVGSRNTSRFLCFFFFCIILRWILDFIDC